MTFDTPLAVIERIIAADPVTPTETRAAVSVLLTRFEDLTLLIDDIVDRKMSDGFKLQQIWLQSQIVQCEMDSKLLSDLHIEASDTLGHLKNSFPCAT